MWKIVHIFDGEYGCEETTDVMVLVTLENEYHEKKVVSVSDSWLYQKELEVGSEWPKEKDY